MSQRIFELLPLKPADLQILLALLEGELHPYGLMKEVEEQSEGKVRLHLGSLYRVIDRLLRQGLIDRGSDDELDGRRRRYAITDLGRRVAQAEAERLADVVELARRRRLMPELSPGPRGRR